MDERCVEAAFTRKRFSTTIPRMTRRLFLLLASMCFLMSPFAPSLAAQQTPRSSSPARTLLLPRRIVSGEHATLAVLDGSGRLTPGVTVTFSNGDHIKTDATGRVLFVAPLDPGVVFASIEGRPGRVATVILTPAEVATPSIEISSAPRIASLTDRFEIFGKGFCGDADANQVAIAGQRAFVLASSPASLIILPSADLAPGPAPVDITCAQRKGPEFSLTFVELALKADSSPLKRSEHRTLSVRVKGTTEQVTLEARNLASAVAVLSGGDSVQRLSSGGEENVALFDVVGQKAGNFLISIRLVPARARPQ